MISRRLQNELKSLSFSDKVLGIAIILSMISVFFPWYQESDPWGGNPEKYLGVTGPLYLIGTVIFLISLITLYYFYRSTIRKIENNLPVSPEMLYIIGGSLILFFTIIEFSIYFHSKFGINPLRKEARFGMILAVLSASCTIILGFLNFKKSQSSVLPYIYEPPARHEMKPHQSLQERKIPLTDKESSEKEVVNLKMNI